MEVLQQFIDALKDQAPKVAITSVALPVLRWATIGIANFRSHSKIASLRERILAVDKFVANIHQPPEDQSEAKAITIAKDERRKLLDELNRICTPFLELHPRFRRVLAFVQLTPARFLITWVARAIAYGFLAAFIITFLNTGSPLSSITWSVRLFLLVLTTINFEYAYFSERLTQPKVARPLWQRISMLYSSPSKFSNSLVLMMSWPFSALLFGVWRKSPSLRISLGIGIVYFGFLRDHFDRSIGDEVTQELNDDTEKSTIVETPGK